MRLGVRFREILPKRKVNGDLYKKPEDFVVREICSNGELCSIEKGEAILQGEPKTYIHATLVKKNISTFDACSIFCQKNNLNYKEDITYCGLKDTLGVTAQSICIKNKPNSKIKYTNFKKFF